MIARPHDPGFSATSEQRASSDRKLNQAYQNLMTDDAASWEERGTVKPDDVRTAQRGWIKYRDAWLALAIAKGRSAAFANGLAVALSDERAHDLRCLTETAPDPACATA